MRILRRESEDENMGTWGPSTSPSPKTGRNMLVCAGGDDQLPFSVPVAHGSVSDQPGGRGGWRSQASEKKVHHPNTRLLSQAQQLRTDLGKIARNRIFSNTTPPRAQPWSKRGCSSSKWHQIICRCSRCPPRPPACGTSVLPAMTVPHKTLRSFAVVRPWRT
jgi:hypothetical protein